MRSTIVRFFLFVLFVYSSLFSGITQAVSITDIHFKELTLQDGLSDLTILDIAEDKDGYIWIATLSGLNRYSGYDIKQYTPSHDSEHSLPSDIIKALHVDASGQLWVGTYQGLALYRPETDDFASFHSKNSNLKNNYISSISNGNGESFIISSGNWIYLVDIKKTLITPIIKLEEEIKVESLFYTKEQIFVGTIDNGLIAYTTRESEKYVLDEALTKRIGLDNLRINHINYSNDTFWISTSKGLYSFSSNYQQKNIINETKEKNIYFSLIFQDDIWFGSDSSLFIFDEDDSHLVELDMNTSDITGLSQKYLLSGLSDTSSNLWIGSYQGLFKHNKFVSSSRLISTTEEFKEQSLGDTLWGLAEDSSKSLWFATQSKGIGKYDFNHGTTRYLETDPSITFWDIAIDSSDLVWVASSRGLRVFKENDQDIVLEDIILKGVFFENLLKNGKKIWTFDNKSKKIISINTDFLKVKNQEDNLIEVSEPLALESHFTPVFSDDDRRIWLSSNEELFVYDVKKGKISKNFTTEDTDLKSIIKVYEWRNSLWAVTRKNAVFQINKKSYKIRRKYTPTSTRTSALSAEGLDNNIWISTTDSIYSFDIVSFEENHSIQKPQLNFNSFNERVSIKTDDKKIIFAGAQGFNIITPEFIKTIENKKKTKPPLLGKVNIFGSYSEQEMKSKSIDNVNRKIIKLDYKDSRFSLNYRVINPIYPELVKYRYKLVGFDDNWLAADNSMVAQFNNIPFGSYSFEVQAKEKGKTWSDSTTLAIEIDRPPWLQTPALILYAALACCFMLFILRQYQVRKQNQLAIRESEERLKLTLWSSGDELWDWDVYRGQVFRSNTWGTLDFPQDNIRTTSAYDANIHPNDLLRVQQTLKAHLEGQSEFFEQAYRAKTFSNRWIWLLDRGKVVSRDHNGQPVRMTGTLKNIHHLKEAEEQLNLFKRSIENISEGVFITNTNFKFISVNNAYCRYTGETREQALASYLFFHQYPEPFTEEIKKTLKVKGNWFGEVESVRINGEKFEMELNIDAVHDEDGKISHFVGVFSDITSRKSTEKELLKLANTDPLTDLPNRSFFQASHANLVRRGESHALLCLDMDNFKKINDSLGHQTGDVLIKQIAKRIQRMTGKTATCYRLGGDEFSVLLEDKSDIHLITHFAQGLLDILARPFIINKQEFVLGASIGIAFYPDDGTTPQEMLKNADTAMYFAKNNGGNSYKFFSGEMNQNAVRQLQIENLIRQGIKDDLFSVYYQPKVDISSGRLVSMEALVRFEHPSKGIVSPGQFIPLAEQTGQIIDIGEQVLRKALMDTKRWVSQGIFSGRVAVNLSAKQFELPDLDDRIIKVLTEVGLSPLHLECELTEGTLMENPEEGLRMMERLREKGIHLALDDFGTGYSSLAYLKRFPLNTLKIDKAFIDDIAKSNVDRHMAAAIINIAHNLGLKVVAEGVEEEDQLAILRRYQCEMLQGYLYSRPLSAERFEQLLLENQKLHQLINKHNSH